MSKQRDHPLPVEPPWPPGVEGPVVALVDADTAVERHLIGSWIRRHRPAQAQVREIRIPAGKRRRGRVADPALEECLALADDPVLLPIRVAWLAEGRDGDRRISVKDLLVLGDPTDPRAARQRWIRRTHPERIRLIIGEVTRKSEIEQGWRDRSGRGPAEGTPLSEYAALEARLSLERAERVLRSTRYKVPKFLRENLLNSRGFRDDVERLATREGIPVPTMRKRTARYLREIAATPTPFVIDLVTGIMAWVLSLGYAKLDYSEEELRDLYREGRKRPLVFLPSHKSNSDHLALQYVLYRSEFPPNHTAGGINLNFFLIGPLLRRSGIFFIRREFKGNEPYKLVLRRYIEYLLEQRFSLEWYLEGGRSRTGKLRPPRFGLLSYVVDAYLRGLVEDVAFIPVAIAYDQISDIASYASEQVGGKKERESLAWALKFIGGLRKRYGSIHVRFGEPLSLAEAVPAGTDLTSERGRHVVPKLAFEIANRINAVTPVTPISLVTLALLSHPFGGLTVEDTCAVLVPFDDYLRKRNLPTTPDFALTEPVVGRALEDLVSNRVVSRVEGLKKTVYVIEPDRHLAAAYYRNTIIHFFVNRSIVEASLSGMVRDAGSGVAELLARAFAWRALLKFDFFFEGRYEFKDAILEELRLQCPDGIERIDRGDVRGVARRLVPATSPAVLLPFVEAYRIVAEVLADADPTEVLDRETVRERSLRLGLQYAAEGRVSTRESLSTRLFDSGISLAANAGLLDSDARQADRREFVADVQDALADLNAVGNIAPDVPVGHPRVDTFPSRGGADAQK